MRNSANQAGPDDLPEHAAFLRCLARNVPMVSGIVLACPDVYSFMYIACTDPEKLAISGDSRTEATSCPPSGKRLENAGTIQ